jgi:hypothetical protein
VLRWPIEVRPNDHRLVGGIAIGLEFAGKSNRLLSHPQGSDFSHSNASAILKVSRRIVLKMKTWLSRFRVLAFLSRSVVEPVEPGERHARCTQDASQERSGRIRRSGGRYRRSCPSHDSRTSKRALGMHRHLPSKSSPHDFAETVPVNLSCRALPSPANERAGGPGRLDSGTRPSCYAGGCVAPTPNPSASSPEKRSAVDEGTWTEGIES